MDATHISEIKIENFRGFQHLELTGLQAVNLIVGQNNAGKTSLLEALALVADPKWMGGLPGLLRANAGNVEKRFYRWLIRDVPGVERATLRAGGNFGYNTLIFGRQPLPGLYPVHQSAQLSVQSEGKVENLRVRVISVQQRSPEAVVKSLGNALRRREGEEIIHAILRKVDPRILRVRVDPVEEGNIVAVDIGLSEMIPLTQAGQGVYRLVTILSELIGEAPQICIIDEIENGLHYSVMRQVWKGISEVSSTLGIQVFASTHSRECLEAAQHVFFDEDAENKGDFAVIQLMRVKDQVIGKVLNEARVEAALDNDIELR